MTVSKEGHYAACLKRCVCDMAKQGSPDDEPPVEPGGCVSADPAADPLLADFCAVSWHGKSNRELAAENEALRAENARWIARVKLLERRLDSIMSMAQGRPPREVQAALDAMTNLVTRPRTSG